MRVENQPRHHRQTPLCVCHSERSEESMKIAFTTLGCKLNYAETSTYERGFQAAGWEVVPWTQRADVYLINTCAVT
ncbi:MAG: tRNA (N(6)-L-threonylcarbamoyladenosine(37)-C(2))-methylthiotransferase MtaB, partial [Bacteroidales bacterium]|nr:tRNA (N(6)-L-threonylcarbamoyladenosine(37)-C(2))-methylthiotransferase MtaB [Bacteroidales bacterium]